MHSSEISGKNRGDRVAVVNCDTLDAVVVMLTADSKIEASVRMALLLCPSLPMKSIIRELRQRRNPEAPLFGEREHAARFGNFVATEAFGRGSQTPLKVLQAGFGWGF
jgi:hypothetical protein